MSLRLYQGYLATVKKCVEKKTGATRAVKIMKTDDEEMLNIAMKEFEIQKLLKHTNIVEVKELLVDEARNT